MYSEFSTDPKVQMMTEVMQRRLLMVMCLRCSNALLTLRHDEIAFQLRITDTELDATKALFIDKGFIDNDWNVLNWDRRQFRSDIDPTRNDRQKRHREKVSNALRNGPVTPLEQNRTEQIQNRTDTEHKKIVAKKSSVQLPNGFEPAQSHFDLANDLGVDLKTEFAQFCDYHGAKGSVMKNWGLALNNWLRNANKFSKGAGNGKNAGSRGGGVAGTIAELTGANRGHPQIIEGQANRVN